MFQNFRKPFIFRTVAFFLIAVYVTACNSGSDPELALGSYAHAVRENRCDDALKLMSERTRHAIDVLRVKPQHPQNPLPIEYYYCNQLTFEYCKLEKMTLAASQTDTATVSMPCGRTQDSFLPGFSSPFLKYEPRSFELIREDGEWHVVDPMVIRIAEIRETEDRMRDAELRRQEEIKRKHKNPSL